MTSEILIETRNLLRDERNWFGPDGTRHRWPRGARCAGLGICETALKHGVAPREANNAFLRAIGLKPASDGSASQIVDWNNAPERTHSDVMLAFASAIELAEADESKAAGTLEMPAEETRAAQAPVLAL